MNKMKIALLLSLAIITPKFLETRYTLTTEVVDVVKPNQEYPEGLVICSTDNGNLFCFYGSEDWLVGDIAELTMNDNGTAYRIDDDIIEKAIYTGYVE